MLIAFIYALIIGGVMSSFSPIGRAVANANEQASRLKVIYRLDDLDHVNGLCDHVDDVL